MPLPFDVLDAESDEAAEAFLTRSDRASLDRGVAAVEALLAHPDWGAQTAERRCGLLSRGSGLLLQRFKAKGGVDDLKEAIRLLRTAVEVPGATDAVLGSVLGNLGVALRNAAEQFDDAAALDEAIDVRRRALLLPGDALARWGRTLNLAMALFARLETRGAPDDVSEMRALLDSAYEDAPTPDRAAQAASNRAILERLLFELGSDPSDLERAVSFAEAAVTRSTPGHPQRPSRLKNLGICLGARLAVHGQPSDGRRAVAALTEARRAVPASHAEAGTRAMNLGSAHLTLFQVDHDRADLEAATAALGEAAAGLPTEHAYRGAVLTALSQGLTAQGLLEGAPHLLDRAVDAALQAVAATMRVPKAKPAALAAAASALLERSLRHGPDVDRADCSAAIDEALSLAPVGSLDDLTLRLIRLRVRALDAQATGDSTKVSEMLREGCVALSGMSRRIAAAGTMAGLVERLVAARRELVSIALASDDPGGALALIETGKAYGLLRDVLRSERVPAGLAGREIDEYRATAGRLRVLDALPASSSGPIGLGSWVDHAAETSSLARRIAELERRDPVFAPRVPVDSGAVRRVAEQSGAVLIYLVVGMEGSGAALVVDPGTAADRPVDVVPLPG